MKQHICLFDMDGTLTEPRQEIKTEMIMSLQSLSRHSEIGIVTGSDIDYVKQQCADLFMHPNTNLNRFFLFPCNGTKSYQWCFENFDWRETSAVNMVDHVGQDEYNKILQSMYSFQLMITLGFQLPFTGTFFQYRGSMLNWCPIGRDAGMEERKAWVDADIEYKIREYWVKEVKDMFSKENVDLTVALGGSTSFDIYPTGWDKTYVMNHLNDYSTAYFVGDKCQEGGNDKALFDLLVEDNLAFETEGPAKTNKIILDIIETLKESIKEEATIESK